MCEGDVLSDEGFDILFRDARTYNAWQDKDVSDTILKALHDVVKYGPTSANCCPMRLKFLKTPEAKERLKPYLMEANVEKTMTAPVVALVAYDMEFYEHLPELFPHTDAKSWFVGKDDYIKETAIRNGTLQGGYLILAARGLGLDCGPMSGFDADGVNQEFFGGTSYKINFLCNLGYGSTENLFPRSPRFEFDEIAEIL